MRKPSNHCKRTNQSWVITRELNVIGVHEYSRNLFKVIQGQLFLKDKTVTINFLLATLYINDLSKSIVRSLVNVYDNSLSGHLQTSRTSELSSSPLLWFSLGG